MQQTLTIEYGDDLLAGLGLSPAEFNEEAKFLLAAKLYELGRFTAGQAPRFCGKSRIEFLLSLPRIGVPACNLREEDAQVELEFGRNE